MQRFPHTIIVEKTENQFNPYDDAEFDEVYKGECNCFCDGRAAYHSAKTESNDYTVVIPDPDMEDVAEGSKIRIINYRKDGLELIGYAVDFMRYSRVCNLYFRMAKSATEE